MPTLGVANLRRARVLAKRSCSCCRSIFRSNIRFDGQETLGNPLPLSSGHEAFLPLLPLQLRTHRLDTAGTTAVRASEAFYAGNRNLQGGTAVDGKFFLDATRYSGALFTGGVNQASKVYKAGDGKWGWMAEGIHRTPAGRLWIVTEGHVNMPRIVFAAKASEIP